MIERITVLCTGNICRSPMAAALLTHGLKARGATARVASAGLGAMLGHGADAHAIRLLAARGLDISDHRAAQFAITDGLASDLILVMDTEQRQRVESRWPLLQGRVYTLGHWSDEEVADPYRRGEAAFADALEKIDRGTELWLARLAP